MRLMCWRQGSVGKETKGIRIEKNSSLFLPLDVLEICEIKDCASRLFISHTILARCIVARRIDVFFGDFQIKK
jgi:hypothetical protein